MVSFGASSGAPDPVAIETFNSKGSLYLTRPGLAAHIGDVEEYRARARSVFDAVDAGTIVPDVWRRRTRFGRRYIVNVIPTLD